MGRNYTNNYFKFSRGSSVQNSIEDRGYQKGYKDRICCR